LAQPERDVSLTTYAFSGFRAAPVPPRRPPPAALPGPWRRGRAGVACGTPGRGGRGRVCSVLAPSPRVVVW